MFKHTDRNYNSVVMLAVLVNWRETACIVVPKIKIS